MPGTVQGAQSHLLQIISTRLGGGYYYSSLKRDKRSISELQRKTETEFDFSGVDDPPGETGWNG